MSDTTTGLEQCHQLDAHHPHTITEGHEIVGTCLGLTPRQAVRAALKRARAKTPPAPPTEEQPAGWDPGPRPEQTNPWAWAEATTPTPDEFAAWLAGETPEMIAWTMGVLYYQAEAGARCYQAEHHQLLEQMRNDNLELITAGRRHYTAWHSARRRAATLHNAQQQINVLIAALTDQLGGTTRITDTEQVTQAGLGGRWRIWAEPDTADLIITTNPQITAEELAAVTDAELDQARQALAAQQALEQLNANEPIDQAIADTLEPPA